MKLNWITNLIPIAVLSVGLASLGSAQVAAPTGTKIVAAKHKKAGWKAIRSAVAMLSLTPDQHSKVHALMKARRQDLKQYRETHIGGEIVDRPGQKAHTETANKAFLSGLQGVLTSTQWSQFQTSLSGRK